MMPAQRQASARTGGITTYISGGAGMASFLGGGADKGAIRAAKEQKRLAIEQRRDDLTEEQRLKQVTERSLATRARDRGRGLLRFAAPLGAG